MDRFEIMGGCAQCDYVGVVRYSHKLDDYLCPRCRQELLTKLAGLAIAAHPPAAPGTERE